MNDLTKPCSTCTEARQLCFAISQHWQNDAIQLTGKEETGNRNAEKPSVAIDIASLKIDCQVCHGTGWVLSVDGEHFARVLAAREAQAGHQDDESTF